MPYVTPEAIQEAKRMDLLTYLKNYEPHELVHFSSNTYTTKTHDSLKISNGKWMWWSRGIGGKSALDYLIKVQGMGLPEAVIQIIGQTAIKTPVYVPAERKRERERKLLLPAVNPHASYAYSYLNGRGIDLDLIRFCIKTGRLYESQQYYNVIFVGLDKENTPRYAAMRGVGSDFIGEVNGSDKHYSFSIPAEEKTDTVHLFESAIDLLSYATLLKIDGQEWHSEHLLSLAGVYQPARKMEESKIPAALTRFLNEHTEIKKIVFHFDNDYVGKLAVKAIQTVLPKQYQTEDKPPQKGKDYNDFLCMQLGLKLTKREKRSKER